MVAQPKRQRRAEVPEMAAMGSSLRQIRGWVADNPSAAQSSAALAALLDECRALLQQAEGPPPQAASALFSLPPELLLRVLAHCDARSLGRLDCTCRLLHAPQRHGRSLIEEALEEASALQMGLPPAMLPLKHGVAARLHCMEAARTAAKNWAELPAWQVQLPPEDPPLSPEKRVRNLLKRAAEEPHVSLIVGHVCLDLLVQRGRVRVPGGMAGEWLAAALCEASRLYGARVGFYATRVLLRAVPQIITISHALPLVGALPLEVPATGLVGFSPRVWAAALVRLMRLFEKDERLQEEACRALDRLLQDDAWWQTEPGAADAAGPSAAEASEHGARVAVLHAGGREVLDAAIRNHEGKESDVARRVAGVAKRAKTRLAPPGISHPHPLRAASPQEVYAWCLGRFCCDMCKAWKKEPILYHCDECGTYDACAACVEAGTVTGMLVVAEGERPSPYVAEMHEATDEESGDDGVEDEAGLFEDGEDDAASDDEEGDEADEGDEGANP